MKVMYMYKNRVTINFQLICIYEDTDEPIKVPIAAASSTKPEPYAPASYELFNELFPDRRVPYKKSIQYKTL